ncbi:MAG: creatininase family protein [Anaerolineae bacterium]
MGVALAEELNGHKWKEMRDKYDKAILAVGSLENHGDHLPFGTDTLVSYALSKEVAERVGGLLVLPPIFYGMSEHYKDFSFTVSVQYETLTALLKDILLSLHREGIYKAFIFNGHDGNSAPIEIAARTVKVMHPEMKIAVQDAWWITAGQLLPPGTFEVWGGLGHAGEGETSICLALFPHLVEMEYARGVVPMLPPNADIKWKFSELTRFGATGDPTKGTKEKGEAMRKVLVDAVVEFIKTLDEMNWEYELK